MADGPQIRKIPAQEQTICNGCSRLSKTPGLRGHNEVTDSYFCQHEYFNKENGHFNRKGKPIHFNILYPCTTPDWCPFLQTSKPEKDEN